MFNSVLMICTGNICRSPAAQFALRQKLPALKVDSAGLGALVDHDMADDMRKLAEASGVECPPHRARQLTLELCRQYDLLIVMEQRQRDDILRKFPQVSGKVFLLSHWSGGADIPDPWKKSSDVYEIAWDMIREGVNSWSTRLGG